MEIDNYAKEKIDICKICEKFLYLSLLYIYLLNISYAESTNAKYYLGINNNIKNIVIVEKEKYGELLAYCDAPPTKYDGTWAISEDEIKNFELRLPEVMNNKIMNKKIGKYNKDEWLRQYAGIFLRGEKYIYVKFYGPDLVKAEPDIKDGPVMLCGRGINTFPLIYNLDKNVFVSATEMR